MMDLIQRFFSKERTHKTEVRKSFSQYFFSQPEHQWIISSNARKHFEKLFSLLPSNLLEALSTKYPISFVKSQDYKPVHHLHMPLSNTIVVFPEFQKLLESDKRSAVAYLAHELALVVYELEVGGKDVIVAEVEADKFVCDLGLVFELEEFLLMMDETIEKRLRLTYLTAHHFSNDH